MHEEKELWDVDEQIVWDEGYEVSALVQMLLVDLYCMAAEFKRE